MLITKGKKYITGSIASENGGGIYVAEGSILITESNFEDCTAKGTSATKGGGAIYINGNVTVDNSTFERLSASSDNAAGIYVQAGTSIISNSSFDAVRSIRSFINHPMSSI